VIRAAVKFPCVRMLWPKGKTMAKRLKAGRLEGDDTGMDVS